ncbi:MAG: flippase, partial [Candidatus Micrarchaeota archaeon]|nr:flippase [Candidatus Micrarchaeota archaeon]
MEDKDVSQDFARIAKGAGIVFLGMLASKVLTYAWRLVVARFGPEAYGLVSLGIALLTIATTLCMLGFANGVERFVAYHYGKKDSKKLANTLRLGLGVCLLTTVAVAVVGFVFAGTLADTVFGKPELAVILQILALALPASAFIEIYAAAFRGIQRVGEIVLARNFLDSFFKIALALVPMALGAGLAGLAAGYVAALYLTFLSLAVLMRRHVQLGKPTWDAELAAYSLPLLALSIITTSMPYIDTIVLGIYRSATEVGVYNAAFPAAQLLLIAPTAIFSLFLSVITANFAQKNEKAVGTLYRRVSKWVFLANVPVLAFLVLFPEKTLYHFFGPEYAVAAGALAVLAAGNFVFSFFWSSLFIHNMMKRTRELVYFPAVALLMNVVLNVILIPLYGIDGAAVATTTALFVYGGLFFWNTHRLLNVFPLDKKSVAAAIVAGVLFSAYHLAAQF